MGIVKRIRDLVFMALVALGIIALAIYGERLIVDSNLTVIIGNGGGLSRDQWLADFQMRAAVGVISAWVASTVWYLVCQLSRLSDWRQASSQRTFWYLLALLPLVVFVALWLTMPAAQEGQPLAAIFILLNNVAAYYIATICFSPPSFKYTPPAAALIRRW